MLISTTSAFSAKHCLPDSEECVFSVFPHTGFRQLLYTYKNITEDLSVELDTRVRLTSSRSMTDFSEKVKKGAFDIALIGPGQYIVYGRPGGYIPVASRDNQISFSLVVRRDSAIKNYQDLVGKRLGMMVEHTTTWFTASYLLAQQGVEQNQMTVTEYGSQQACAYALASQLVDACFMAETILNIFKERNLQIKLKTLPPKLKTINAVYVLHPDLPLEQQALIKDYFLGRSGYSEAKDSDFDIFREEMKGLFQ